MSSYEGDDIARWLNSFGVAGFVLKYRIAPRYHHPAPLQDAQQAIRMVRAHGQEWRVRSDRVGICGFSAGGHLASTAGTHFDAGSRPDFMILAYAVISFTTPFTHQGSKKNLIGDNPDPKLAESLSNELQVTAQTPPTFLFHTTTDKTVPVENSVLFYMALRKAGVPAEMHLYANGPHGTGGDGPGAVFLAATPGGMDGRARTTQPRFAVKGWLRRPLPPSRERVPCSVSLSILPRHSSFCSPFLPVCTLTNVKPLPSSLPL